jgi:very-short-patch-repair endonuclease
MEKLIALLILVALAGAVIRALVAHIAKSSASAEPKIAFGRPGLKSSAGLPPFAKRNYFFSAAERSFYEILCRLAPQHRVFAKVRLADLVRVQASGREFWQRFNSIAGKHVDFVLCDECLAPLVAIELDDASHDDEERLARDRFVDSVLETATLPIVHVRAKRGYVLDEIRQLLAPHLPSGWKPNV